MKKIAWILVLLVFIGYSVNTCIERKELKQAEKVERLKIETEIKSNISNIVAKHGAIDGWEKVLGKRESFRSEPIMTIELEKIWLNGKPILFLSSIKDISSLDSDKYLLKLESSIYGSTGYRLSVVASREYIDSFLASYPKLFEDFGFNNRVAVIASIHEIESSEGLDEDGLKEEIKTGKGVLVDMIYTGDVTY